MSETDHVKGGQERKERTKKKRAGTMDAPAHVDVWDRNVKEGKDKECAGAGRACLGLMHVKGEQGQWMSRRSEGVSGTDACKGRARITDVQVLGWVLPGKQQE